MGNFLDRYAKPKATPPPQVNAPGQPEPGGTPLPYRVEGMWQPDGTVEQPTKLVIELEGGRRSERVGDVLMLTRLEAHVVGKRVLLTPIVKKPEA